ncbi:hypothetical protein [Streptomyces sp. WMMC940]|uniref:hypothetical protein n=1 Tax=Streptomyces sp. WMMC940 TaxID=3015153 RepID=UPI0022B6BE7D|nr:hypothetical protein [Streptomyces sp. WMMC940]MCZ7459023.1 hypothetical protein [Streptomyces sp. WMMC940]
MDAEIGLKAVEHLLGMFTAARMRLATEVSRCEECESYSIVGGTCSHCGWTDESYEPPVYVALSEEERERRLSTPCTPSSDISTFMTPEDLQRSGRRDARAVPGPPEGAQQRLTVTNEDQSGTENQAVDL